MLLIDSKTNIKPLKKELIGTGEVRGFKFRQISMTNQGFLYEVNTGSSIYYEVFRKRINHRFGCFSYPTSKGFGIWAWCFDSLKDASIKLKSL